MKVSYVMLQKIKESASYIANRIVKRPIIGIILGSGLGNFANEIITEAEIPYSEIPHFPISKVEGHKGALLIGNYNGVPVVIMQGRVHFYEGFGMEEVTYPVRVMKYLGIETLLLSNAAGGMNPEFSTGDLMVITDHIHLMPNPLIGNHIVEFGPRFPDMSEAYDKKLIGLADSVSEAMKLNIRYGVYVGVTGPTYETPAEYSCFRHIGGDAIGMSTTPEVIVARQMGIRCFAVSVITDLGIAGHIEFLTHEQVKQAAMEAEPRLARLFTGMIERYYY
jgi:purine-nucleoside phosphorylase